MRRKNFIILTMEEFEAFNQLVLAAEKFLECRKSDRQIAAALEKLLKEEQAEKDGENPCAG